ncbi:MAG: calcium/sodium antiporter [Oscillospiraceae bacterium]|nr:calcium/sodium antiporter [Oscillospiraceae bacterium]
MLDLLLLVVGFAVLIKGADVFVDSGVGIAKKLKIPSVIIGLTIVSLGTSAPEAVVSITASLKGEASLAIGNIVGSNLFNLLFVVGLCALMKPFAVILKEIAKDFWISIAATVILLSAMVFFSENIPQWFAVVMLVFFAVYIALLIRQAVKNPVTDSPDESEAKTRSMWFNVLGAILGCACIVIGGQVAVTGAKNIAVAFNISERIIGLTVLAIGTSLPELVTSVVAAKKGESGIALGNVVGSNIFNILFILGMAGAISPLGIDMNLLFDTAALAISSLVAIVFIYTKSRITRSEGFALILMYVGYMTYVIVK